MGSLDRMFGEFRREAFRLETLDTYDIPRLNDHLRAFLAGEEQPEGFRNSPWVSTVRDATRQGKRVYRVHILSRPLTDYLRYELAWGYHRNAQAGEEFFILDTTGRENPLPDVPDFWLFDENTVAVMRYDASGAFQGFDLLGSDEAAAYVAYRDKALAEAEPFFEWWEAHGSR
jgi:hypothetical protein